MLGFMPLLRNASANNPTYQKRLYLIFIPNWQFGRERSPFRIRLPKQSEPLPRSEWEWGEQTGKHCVACEVVIK
jgi:hypothetical protein